ncbi:glycosyl hydrolase family 28 protein [Pelagicoccus mobilis]|uniref:Glycosyl hydrolases family 28 n=1 Tax=Pelagicoccus mobilis TaxID=415221 RepID=A0A934S3E8_9BACT|nr:glycosyl hydrolase family 28 protein [Pelagicoccus mobilis]MBK1880470.1 hypothetical protein [Pelagicoccus mobilis]
MSEAYSKPYDYAEDAPRSVHYAARINGESCLVCNAGEQDFLAFEFEGEVEVEIVCFVRQSLESLTLRPTRHKIQTERGDYSYRFRLNEPTDLCAELEGLPNLYIFASGPETDIPDPEDPNVHYFEAGKIHEVGELRLADGERIHIEGGAIVRGAIRARNAANITISGRGVLDGDYEPWRGSYRILSVFDHCRDLSIRDIIIIRPQFMPITLGKCEDVVISRVRELTDLVSTDGVDVCASKNVLIEDCFFVNNDDCIALKALKFEYTPYDCDYDWRGDIENVVARRCVLLNKRAGNALEIGHETNADSIRNVRFEDLDILDFGGSGGVFAIHNCDRALVSNVRYESIRVERYWGMVFDVRVLRSRFSDVDGGQLGCIKNIVFKDLQITQRSMNVGYSVSVMGGQSEESCVSDVTFQNIQINDQAVETLDELDLFTRYSKNLRLEC